TPAIGFLRPFGCHVMILNTLDHLGKFDAKGDEGSSSTNISGTKDTASQDVKKDVSSLRYIALTNWFHEAHMESSNNDAQDACNADAPKSSRISNPTATSKSLLAEQIESLTVESAISIVSSLVPTACLDISPETTSGSILISKEVIQEETPSLDNDLTLSNRFEDTIRVEADLSNMESSIPASHTPTLRIHKDHPKSQIIGHVDTSEEPKKIFDALKDPIAMIEAIRLFLAYASFMRFTVYQIDVKSAFLYGTINEEVYVMQPPGFQDPEFLDRVYKVEKVMYGLHQTPRAWYGTLSKYFLDNGFQMGLIHDKFQMSAMGELNFFLGLQVLQKKDVIFLSQDKYVGDILKKFGYSDVRSANTPMDKENPWGNNGPGKDVELHLYRSMIGSLMYRTASRPDIMFAVCACARHQVTPKECYFHAVKIIFRYLKGHLKLGLWYPKESSFNLVAYSNSDYGGATQDMKSTTRGCQFLGRRLISWIKTTNEGTKILATVDGKPMIISESSIRRNLKLNNEEGISSLPDAELFENLALMGYSILSKQKFTFQKGTPTESHHTPSPQEQHSSDHDTSSSSHPTASTETIPTSTPTDIPTAFPTVSGLDAGQDRENIIKPSAFPHDSTPRVTSLDADEGSIQQQLQELTDLCTHLQRQQTEMASKINAQDLEISSLKARIKLLEDKDKELGVADVSVPPVAEVLTVGVPTVSGLVPTVSAIFTTASVVTPYSRRTREISAKDKDCKRCGNSRIHAEEELKIMIDGLDRNNEVIARHLQEYEEYSTDLTIGEKIELINQLVEYQDHHAKILKYQAQQSKPLSKKEQREFYRSVLRSHSGWKTKHFRGMTLEEIREKFIPVWKQIEDFVPMSSKEEAKRFKRKGLRLEHGSAKRMKTSEDVSEEDNKEIMQLVPVEEVYVEALQAKHPIIDWEIHFKGQKDYYRTIRLGGHTVVYQFFYGYAKAV
nr:hypothetical protein [Tanacetum cinerariifolium]